MSHATLMLKEEVLHKRRMLVITGLLDHFLTSPDDATRAITLASGRPADSGLHKALVILVRTSYDHCRAWDRHENPIVGRKVCMKGSQEEKPLRINMTAVINGEHVPAECGQHGDEHYAHQEGGLRVGLT